MFFFDGTPKEENEEIEEILRKKIVKEKKSVRFKVNKFSLFIFDDSVLLNNYEDNWSSISSAPMITLLTHTAAITNITQGD